MVIEIASVDEVAGIANAVTVGTVVSGSVMVVVALTLAEILPAASFAHAYNVLSPCVDNVYVVGALVVHPESLTDGVDDASVTRYPVTATLSVAVNVLIETASVVDVAGIVKAVTAGGVISIGTTIVNTCALLMPPPGVGLVTVINALDVAIVRSEAGMTAVSYVAETYVVVRDEPLKLIVELETKLVPFTVRVNWASPTVLEVGEILEVVGSGLLIVNDWSTLGAAL